MNIYEIKRLTKETSPYFFSRNTLKFFGQRMKDFKVYKQFDGRYLITAPIIDFRGKNIGNTRRYFNPVNNKMENE